MPAQISLEGFDPPAPPIDRLFFALFPPTAVASRIDELAQRLRADCGLKGKTLQPGRLHVTLHHLGDYAGLQQGLVSAARAAASAVRAQPFEVTFDRVMSFSRKPTNRPFVLRGDAGLAELIAFQQSLGAAMKKTVLGSWAESHFTPHVTLLYDDSEVAEQAVEPLSWTVSDFALVHSLIGKTRHTVLGRWSLTGQELSI